MTIDRIKTGIIKFLDNINEESKVSFREYYRIWPFVVMYILGAAAGCYSILLPPGPDSPHFIDPSVKFLFVFLFFIILMIKPTVRLAKKNKN